MYLKDGKKIKGIIQINNINYSPSFFDTMLDDDLAFLGVTRVDDPVSPDPEYFTWTENEDGSLNVVQKSNLEIFNEKVIELNDVVTKYLDAKAAEHGYDSIISACSYIGVTNAFEAESKTFLAWRASVWVTCGDIKNQVSAGTMAIPTDAELIALLPVYVGV